MAERVDDVVTGDAVRSRADEARRALHAAARRRGPGPPPRPRPSAPAPSAEAAPPDVVPDVDPRLQALADENRALRTEVAALRDALRRLRDQAAATLDGSRPHDPA